MSPKVCGGLVIVDPARLAAVSQYGVDQLALKVPWEAINPNPGVYNWSFIDNYLADYPGVRFTLRVQSGDTAPQWVKDIRGTVEVYNVARNRTAYVPYWWDLDVAQAWTDMTNALGARYDMNPRVVMVSAGSSMVVYTEPFILGSHGPSGVRLYNAGLNETARINSIVRCVDDTIAAFPNTLVELAIHASLQIPTASGIEFSWPKGRNLCLGLMETYGKHLVLSDYGLGTADTLATHAPAGGETIFNTTDEYTFMHLRTLPSAGTRQGPITFQLTVGQEPQTQETYQQAAQNAIDLGAWQCETAGWGLLGSSASTYDAALKSNAAEGFPTETSTPPPVVTEGDTIHIRDGGAWVAKKMMRVT